MNDTDRDATDKLLHRLILLTAILASAALWWPMSAQAMSPSARSGAGAPMQEIVTVTRRAPH